MTYLSRIMINPLRVAGRRMLANPQVMHAAVLGGISRQPVAERTLWRIETDSPHRPALLVLTETRPSWEHLVEQAGWPGSDDAQAQIRPYEPLLERLLRGREFAFRLRANPVTSTRHPVKPSSAQAERLAGPRPRGVRVPHRTVEHQLNWLTEHLSDWGFDLALTAAGDVDVRLTARDRLSFAKKSESREAARRVTLQTATFEGRVTVNDPEKAVASLLGGVGPARAYGCGLITLAPSARRLVTHAAGSTVSPASES